jgi:hypothetical protein
MLRYAASFVVAAYVKVRLTPQALRALPAELFTKPPASQKARMLKMRPLKNGFAASQKSFPLRGQPDVIMIDDKPLT